MTINIPRDLSTLYANTFKGCNKIKNVTYSAARCSTDGKVFADIEEFTHLSFTEGVEWIPSHMFENCKYLTGIVIPNSVKHIREFAFAGCSGIVDVLFGNDIAIIDSCAFSGCSSLEMVNLAPAIERIGAEAFRDCESLSRLIIVPSGDCQIGNRAFVGCSSLPNVTLGANISEIGDFAFASTAIESFELPQNTTTIGAAILADNSKLTSLTVNSGNTHFDSRDECNAIIRTADNTLVAGSNVAVIPESVTSIADFAFNAACDMDSIVVPNSVKSIGNEAFSSCENLEKITLGNSVQTIGMGAFWGCGKLSDLISKNDTPPTFSSSSIFDSTAFMKCKVYVSNEAYDAYRNAPLWKNFLRMVAVDFSGIENVTVSDAVEVARYDIYGRQLTQPTQGINIVKMSDGSVKKESVKR